MDTPSPNAQTPRRGVLVGITPFVVLTTVFMYFFFDQQGWSTSGVVFEAVLVLICICLILTIVDAREFWWAPRMLTFIVFATYLSYLLYEFWFTQKPLNPTLRGDTPFRSILGFLVFGVPCLLYTFWGSTWGKLGHAEPENVDRWDIATFYLARGAKWLFTALSVFALVATLWKAGVRLE